MSGHTDMLEEDGLAPALVTALQRPDSDSDDRYVGVPRQCETGTAGISQIADICQYAAMAQARAQGVRAAQHY
jgi:hypothetical protein